MHPVAFAITEHLTIRAFPFFSPLAVTIRFKLIIPDINEIVFIDVPLVEVAPKGFDTGGIYESYGRGWLIQIPDEKENILKQGEWNTMRIRVQGDNVQTWLNGEEMVNIRDEKIGRASCRERV